MKQIPFLFAFFLFVCFGNAQNTFFGIGAGQGGNYASHFGLDAGRISTGTHNTFIGYRAGYDNVEGNYNVFLGAHAGGRTNSGNSNTFLGQGAGQFNKGGSSNTNIGYQAGQQNIEGERNTCLGYRAGVTNTGNNNIFLGYQAGFSEPGSNKLYIHNTGTSTPLIYGDFSTNQLAFNATVSIGDVTEPSGYRLYVEEGILAEKIKVATNGSTYWADFVFDEDYDLNTIEEVADYISKNHHLPNVPSTIEVQTNGVEMVKMDATLLRQIEELWLHVMDMNEQLKEVNEENNLLNEKIKTLERSIKNN